MRKPLPELGAPTFISSALPYPSSAPPFAPAHGGPPTPPRLPEPVTLDGHHRSWQVHHAPPGGDTPPGARLKTGEPRHHVPRFDPRCILDEDGLLRRLERRGVPRVPRAHRTANGLQTHDYIEGTALSAPHPPGSWLTANQVGHVTELFGHIAGLGPADLATLHNCPPATRPTDSASFLQSLLRFTRVRVHRRYAPLLPGLFAALGVRPDAVAPDGPLGRSARHLTGRPFCLLHGDLHRDNLIVSASDGALWTIDWELALVGDPLYDLATHLHLMRYPRAQEAAVVHRWATAVESVLPGAAAGLEADLPRYLRYKRVQSVLTDTVRNADAVRSAPPDRLAAQLATSAAQMHDVLLRAAGPLGLLRVPTATRVEHAYAALRGLTPAHSGKG